jgi:hypothetical protein
MRVLIGTRKTSVHVHLSRFLPLHTTEREHQREREEGRRGGSGGVKQGAGREGAEDRGGKRIGLELRVWTPRANKRSRRTAQTKISLLNIACVCFVLIFEAFLFL